MRIKKNDNVQIISGNHRGKTGRVIKVMLSKNRAIVEGVNIAKKHIRPNQDNPQGGIVDKELSIHLSNLMLLYKGKPTKVAFEISKNGKKVRVNKDNRNLID